MATENCTCLYFMMSVNDDTFPTSLFEVASNQTNSLEQRTAWQEIAYNIKTKDIPKTESKLKTTLDQFYSREFQLDLSKSWIVKWSKLTDNQKLQNALIPLYLANFTKCQKHIKDLQEYFQNCSNKLFHKIIQLGDKLDVHRLFFLDGTFKYFDLQFMFDVVHDQPGQTSRIFFCAIRRDEVEIVKILTENNPKWKEYKNMHTGTNALVNAAWYGSFASMKYLLSLPNKPDVNDNDNNYKTTAAHQAALGTFSEEKSMKVLELLVAAGADLQLKNKSGDSPLNLAAYKGNVEITKYLLLQNPTRAEVKKALDEAKSLCKKNKSAIISALENTLQSMPRSKFLGIF